ncbi:hypothetical protein AAVH_30598, partial [Aphelenchoides avenae]
MDHMKNDHNRIPLLFTMLNDYYPPFHDLDVDSKITVLEQALHSMNILNAAFLTSQVFPDPADTRYVLSCGYYMDMTRMRDFLKDAVPEEGVDDYIKIKLPMMSEFRALASKIGNANVRLTDAAALMCIAVWTDVEHNGVLTDAMEQHKEAVITEWSEELCCTYGPQLACRQTAKLMSLLVDLR